MLDKKTIESYNSGRFVHSVDNLCHAPFTNMYFNSWGNAGACWLTLDNAPQYPQNSLKEIWFGPYFESLRNNIKCNKLEVSCGVCEKRIIDGVYSQVLARAYDLPYSNIAHPQIMEFELSNLCNLACVMCKGSLSSKIRKEREQLGPLKSPYDDQFVEQLKEFIPHLKEARFNGGEPFLQQICWKIWEQIAAIKPDILITVATNGTLLTEKMKEVMERCKFRINVSLDSLKKDVYESIRVGGNHDSVIENLKYYRDYCQRKQTILSIMVNPLRTNWEEMPEYVRWCTKNNYHLWFNTIWRPRHLALWTLSAEELRKIQHNYLNEKFVLPKDGSPALFDHNLRVFESLATHQIGGWIKDQLEREESGTDYSSIVKKFDKAQKNFIDRPVYNKHLSKFDWIEKRTDKALTIGRLYYYFGQLTDDEADRNLTYLVGDQLLEWVYKICDYY